jgi:hypothetical protein
VVDHTAVDEEAETGMEELLIFRDVLERLESSPFDAALEAGPNDPVVAASIGWTFQFMETFIGPDGVQALLGEGSPPLWMAQLLAADASDALEREWIARGDLESFLTADFMTVDQSMGSRSGRTSRPHRSW